MGKESFENFERDNKGTPSEKNDKANKPADTLYYRPFSPKKREAEKITLRKLEQDEEKMEKMKSRFTDLALLLSEGRFDTPVEIAGEKHWMELNRMMKNGVEAKTEDLIRDVGDGFNPAAINIEFKLTKTEGRNESLYIDLQVSAARLIAGGGELREDLKKNITEIFAGTSRHYENIRENERREKENGATGRQVEVREEEKNKMASELENSGAEVSGIGSGGVFTIIAEYPGTGKKVMLSLLGGVEPWRVEMVAGGDNEPESFMGSPDEVLAEIYKFIETDR